MQKLSWVPVTFTDNNMVIINDLKSLKSHEKTYSISHILVNDLLDEMSYKDDFNPIILKIDSIDDGEMTTNIPKDFFKDCSGVQSTNMMVLHNLEEISFKEIIGKKILRAHLILQILIL